jgi:hypothetical protein
MPRRASIEPSPRPKRKSPPHEFFLEALTALNPEVRRMFGGFAVYVGDRIVCMLREAEKSPRDNGIWLVLAEEIDPSDRMLRKEFPSLRNIDLLGGTITHWLLIPSDGEHFESEALHAADLLLAHDFRIGRIPESRKSKPPGRIPIQQRTR